MHLNNGFSESSATTSRSECLDISSNSLSKHSFSMMITEQLLYNYERSYTDSGDEETCGELSG